MPQRSTYYTEEEQQAVEQAAESRDESFSKIVREAIQEKFGL